MNFFNKIIVNWKTSSVGIIAILGSAVTMGFAIKNGTLTESLLSTQIGIIIGGIGFLLSRDVGVSTEKENGHPELEDVGERTGK